MCESPPHSTTERWPGCWVLWFMADLAARPDISLSWIREHPVLTWIWTSVKPAVAQDFYTWWMLGKIYEIQICLSALWSNTEKKQKNNWGMTKICRHVSFSHLFISHRRCPAFPWWLIYNAGWPQTLFFIEFCVEVCSWINPRSDSLAAVSNLIKLLLRSTHGFYKISKNGEKFLL